jgi:small subunit ribosomal protein S9
MTTPRYHSAIGRRKEAVARVRLFPGGDAGVTVNDKTPEAYFGLSALSLTVRAPLEKMKVSDKFSVSVKIVGGGIRGQAEAARLGVARALTDFNPDFRKRLKRLGYLKRDPREKERRKYGLKKARKRPQFSKR